MNYRRPELCDRLAAEYVLGTLHGRARARLQQLLRDDLLLQARVAFWEHKLLPMAAPLWAAAPSAKVWRAIAARVAPREMRRPWWARWFEGRTLGALSAGLTFGLTLGLTSAGMTPEAAVAAVLLYRISTFYLPPAWGFLATRWLTRNRYL